MERITFDTWALLAFVFGEDEADSRDKLLRAVQGNIIEGYFCIVNLAEFYRRISVEENEKSAIEKSAWLMTTGIKFASPNISMAMRAGSMKNKYPNLSYGDGFALACALETNSKLLVTGDPDFNIREINAKTPGGSCEALNLDYPLV